MSGVVYLFIGYVVMKSCILWYFGNVTESIGYVFGNREQMTIFRMMYILNFKPVYTCTSTSTSILQRRTPTVNQTASPYSARPFFEFKKWFLSVAQFMA